MLTPACWVSRTWFPGQAPEKHHERYQGDQERVPRALRGGIQDITTDNGSEFVSLSEIEILADTLVYFDHPYTFCEKGTVERHNGLICRFIPKGMRIDSYSSELIAQIELWSNSLPRKILGYHTPDEIFEEELDKIYGIAA